jgi:hypothetical protein
MVKFGGQFNARRGAADGVPDDKGTIRGKRKEFLFAAAFAGLAVTASHGALADGSLKDGGCDPYKNYKCLDSYLGDGVLERFFNYQMLEIGHGTAPTDPNAPPTSRPGWPRTPATVPPMAYAEWPTGATTSIGVTRPNAVDSPLMVAIANTDAGKWMSDNHLQMYGWVNGGFNLSTNDRGKGANFPVAYTYSSNVASFNQGVLYIERVPDTVQTDHVDWGFRIAGLYGQDYRYTNAYGIGSYQFNGENKANGWDFPMVYGEVFIPKVLEGLNIRFGRYISIPDIEAQLAPNNLTYTHSITYGYDNYTNTGVTASLQTTKQLLLQFGVSVGTETPPWHDSSNRLPNLAQSLPGLGTNPFFGASTFPKDPGNQATFTACARYTWNNGWDSIYPCANGINDGAWGYNNLQWYGFTYYHRFDEKWHIDFEAYTESTRGAPNNRNSTAMAYFNAGGTPFSPQYVKFNAPFLPFCGNADVVKCDPYSIGVLTYLNYTPDPLNNWSLRLEWYDDQFGWRTGTPAKYFDTNLSWQHWLSPQIEFRPEISYWHSFGNAAFNGNPVAAIPGNKRDMVEFASDVIIHF